MASEAECPGVAEVASHGTPHLRGETDSVPFMKGHDDGFNSVSVGIFKEQFNRGIRRSLHGDYLGKCREKMRLGTFYFLYYFFYSMH